jgi:hypothetical protein
LRGAFRDRGPSAGGRRIAGATCLRLATALLACGSFATIPPPASGQSLPSSPLTFDDGRIILGADAAASIAPKDDAYYFNYTDYDHDALRLVRLSALAEWRVASRFTLLGEIRTENWDQLRPYGLYLRVRPWPDRPIDIQVGRIPPTFGAYRRRIYGPDNPLIGTPLAYQYLTSLRADALPASVDDLLKMRGRGWRVAYPVGSIEAAHGLPLVSSLRWDTGVQVRVGRDRIAVTGALTNGTLSNPRVQDDNAGKQVVGRVELRPTAAWIIGVSGARGPYLSGSLSDALPAGTTNGNDTQQAFGVDVDYSYGHLLVRSEVILSHWDVPGISESRDTLGAASWSLEARYKLRPDIYAAARVERLEFTSIEGPNGTREPWDAPVSRVEIGGGYYFARSLIGKASYQWNWRDTDRFNRRQFGALQLQYWF